MWRAGLVALSVLAACAAPTSDFDRVGQGATVQQRIVSTADLDVGSAQQDAANQGFNDARDVGFAASSLAAGGVGGGLAGLAGVLASPATTRETIPHLFFEVPIGTDIAQYKAQVAASAAPLMGIDPANITINTVRHGTFDQKDLHEASFYVKEGSWNRTPVQKVGYYRALAQKYPSLLSAYVPPLRVNGQWQRPYLYRNGQNLTL